jgi:hypothetical protein
MNPFDALRGFGRMLVALVVLLVLAAFAAGSAFAATCNVTEFASPQPVLLPFGNQPALVSANITYTTSSVQSAVFQPSTALVRIQCDAAASVLFGTNPTAVIATSLRLAINETAYFTVTPAQVPPYTALRLAVIGP